MQGSGIKENKDVLSIIDTGLLIINEIVVVKDLSI